MKHCGETTIKAKFQELEVPQFKDIIMDIIKIEQNAVLCYHSVPVARLSIQANLGS